MAIRETPEPQLISLVGSVKTLVKATVEPIELRQQRFEEFLAARSHPKVRRLTAKILPGL